MKVTSHAVAATAAIICFIIKIRLLEVNVSWLCKYDVAHVFSVDGNVLSTIQVCMLLHEVSVISEI